MYIANTTKQHYRPNFRVPERTRIHVVNIPSGQQVKVGDDWNAAQTDSVVKQLEVFGARPARDASGKLQKYSGLLYSLDKPIPVGKIEAAHEALVNEQDQRSADELTKGALGFDAALRDKRTRRRGAKVTSLEVSQDVPPFSKATGKEIKFGVTVTPDGHDKPSVR